MIMDKEVLKQWSKMLQDLDPRAQMEALTQIGRAYFRPEVGPREKKDIKGAIRVKGPAKPGLPASLRDAILEKLQAEDPRIRAEAALALVHWRDDEVINAIVEVLRRDPDTQVRMAAVHFVSLSQDERLMQPLIEVLTKDKDELVRAAAVDTARTIQRKLSKQEERGAVRTRGDLITGLNRALEEVKNTDPSSYVRYLAGAGIGG